MQQKNPNRGDIRTSAKMRGEERYLTGDIDIISRAAISSLTFIVPNSAAMAEPTQAARQSAQLKGAISRISEIITAEPRKVS
jgi:hypothetical protein